MQLQTTVSQTYRKAKCLSHRRTQETHASKYCAIFVLRKHATKAQNCTCKRNREPSHEREGITNCTRKRNREPSHEREGIANCTRKRNRKSSHV